MLAAHSIGRKGATIVFASDKDAKSLQATHMPFEDGILIEYFYKPTSLLSEFRTTPYHTVARKVAHEDTLDPQHPVGAAIVKNGNILCLGANGSDHHDKYGCYRKDNGIPTGEKYELCEGCHPQHHAEAKAIQQLLATYSENDARDLLKGAEVHLYGHWYCCQPCTLLMESYQIRFVFIEKEWVRQHLSL